MVMSDESKSRKQMTRDMAISTSAVNRANIAQ